MSRRILLADDSVTIQKVIELTFMDEDFEVKAVSNGDDAVRLLTELHPEFVIADVHMPGANGYEVCRRSKALAPGVPVLLLVGTFEPFEEGQARAAGSDAFLKKPFDSQELLHIVQGLLDRAGTGGASPAFAAPEPAAPAAEAPWAGFELTAEPEPMPPMPSISPISPFQPEPAAPSGPGFAWSSPTFTPSPPDEQLFELEPDAEGLSLDDSRLAAAPIEEPFSYESREMGGMGGLHPPATPEERVGVPFGASPLAGSLSQVEHQIAAHAAEHEPLPDLPDWASEPLASATPPPAPTPAVAPPATGMPVGSVSLRSDRLSDEDVDRVARRVIELLGDKVVKDVAWEVIPDLAEVVIKDRLRELESQVE